MKSLVGKRFIFENELWLCVRFIGIDMFDFKSEVDGRIITTPYWPQLMKEVK